MFASIISHPARWRYLLPGFLILVLAFNQSAVAADDAAKIIEKSGKFYADQSGLAVDVKVEHLLPEQFAGMGDIPPMSYVYWYQSSNKLAAIPPAGSFDPPIIQDGKQFYTELPIMGAYVLRNALPMADLCEEPGVSYLQLPGVSILAGLGLEANQTGSLRSITGATLVEDEKVGDVDCHHLLVKNDEFEGEIWIAAEGNPWILRMKQPAGEPDMPSSEGGMMMIRPGMDIQLSNWRSNPDFGDVFTIILPDSMEKRETMPTMEEMMASQGVGAGRHGMPEDDHASKGKPAPEIILKPMDGKEIKLSAFKGKVVVLDFWATWCKPCIMALPLVYKVISGLADKGVVFYAVNQRESADRVQTFLKEKGWDIPVVMDRSGSVSTAFGVRGIPHSVLIDKMGVVRKVHTGYGPGLETMLQNEIEELLAE